MGLSYLLFILLMLMSSTLGAEQLKQVFNPFTGKPDYITKVDPSTLITPCGSSPLGIQFTDTASCTWCETIDTGGVLTTALISCPATGFILMEDGTYILQEDGSKIVVE